MGNPTTNQDDARKLHESLQKLHERAGTVLMEYALALQEAHRTELHRPLGFESWRAYIEREIGLSRGKADYLIKVASNLLSNLPSSVPASDLTRLGFFVGAILAKVVRSWTFSDWAAKANTHDTQWLANNARQHRYASGQKRELTTVLKLHLYPEQMANVEDALEMAKDIAESDKRGHLIDLICTTFKADHVFSSSPGTKMSEIYLAKIEHILGINIVAISRSGDFLSGHEYLERIVAQYTETDNQHEGHQAPRTATKGGDGCGKTVGGDGEGPGDRRATLDGGQQGTVSTARE